MLSVSASMTAALQATGALAVPVHFERHWPAARQQSIRHSAQPARSAAAGRAASCSYLCICCHWQPSCQSSNGMPVRCAVCSAHSTTACGSVSAWDTTASNRCGPDFSVTCQQTSGRSTTTISSWASSVPSCCFARVQGLPGHAAVHAPLDVRCAAADRDGDAAERDPLQSPTSAAAKSEPRHTQQALQDAAQQPDSSQHGGALNSAEQLRAMAAALQLSGLAAKQQHLLTGDGSQRGRSSVAQPPPPAQPSPAVVNGKSAALAIIRQHDPT